MRNQNTKETKSHAGAYLLTPLLLLALCAGIAVLCWSLAPTHSLQRYLNLAFMDTLKVSSSTAGLNIRQREINTDSKSDAEPTYETGKINYPTFGEQYAILEAKSINLKVGVYFGVNSELLALGACQSTQSAVAGANGNTVIDAHVNTFFSDLTQLQPEDVVTLYTDYGKFTYKVTQNIEFEKSSKRYIGITDNDCLTLYTCAPQVLGSSDLRVGVRCELVSKEFNTPEE